MYNQDVATARQGLLHENKQEINKSPTAACNKHATVQSYFCLQNWEDTLINVLKKSALQVISEQAATMFTEIHSVNNIGAGGACPRQRGLSRQHVQSHIRKLVPQSDL